MPRKHEDTDDNDIRDFESDFEDTHDTNEEIDDLYNGRNVEMKRMVKAGYFNMDDKKGALKFPVSVINMD